MRDAGEEAWLGREAPPDPDLDAEPDEAPPLLLMPPPEAAGGAPEIIGEPGGAEPRSTLGCDAAEHAVLKGMRKNVTSIGLHSQIDCMLSLA